MKLNLCHPDNILPGLQGAVLGNAFLDRQINEMRTSRVKSYISMYNLDIGNPGYCDNDEEIPCIQRPKLIIPERTWHYHQLKSNAGPNDAADFWCDDDVIIRFIRHPEKYMEELKKRPCVFSLDLSSYQEFRLPIIRYNIYRNRLFTQEMQMNGINAIPAVQWRDRKSFEFCFLGIPKGSVIAFSTVGVLANKVSLQLWKEGVEEAIRVIDPEAIFIYGEPIDYNFGSIDVYHLNNENVRRVRNHGR
jgi:hypothetical protein